MRHCGSGASSSLRGITCQETLVPQHNKQSQSCEALGLLANLQDNVCEAKRAKTGVERETVSHLGRIKAQAQNDLDWDGSLAND